MAGAAGRVGAGISTGFAEALSDDGSLTGVGSPLFRAAVCGLMTAMGGLGHARPFLIRDFHTVTALAIAVIIVELGVVARARDRYMTRRFRLLKAVAGRLSVFGIRLEARDLPRAANALATKVLATVLETGRTCRSQSVQPRARCWAASRSASSGDC